MPALPRCLMIVTAEIDADVEDEWNRWYDEVHLPDALSCPGVLGGSRYRVAREGSVIDHGVKGTDAGKVYVTVYELSGPEAMDTPEFQAMRGWYQFAERIKARTQVVTRL